MTDILSDFEKERMEKEIRKNFKSNAEKSFLSIKKEVNSFLKQIETEKDVWHCFETYEYPDNDLAHQLASAQISRLTLTEEKIRYIREHFWLI